MTLTELKNHYARVSSEIGTLADHGLVSEARLTRLHCELDRIDNDLAALKSRARIAPVLRDVVAWIPAARRGPRRYEISEAA
jgi:hypothetical protein